MELPFYKSIQARQLILIWIIVAILSIVYYLLFDFLRPVQFDSPSYVGAAKLLFGIDGGYDFQGRLSKPLGLLAPGLIAKYTGVSLWNLFILQNILFLFIFATLIHRFSMRFTNNFHVSLSVVFMILTSQTLAVYSLLVLMDISGWLFIVIGLLFITNPNRFTTAYPFDSSKGYRTLAVYSLIMCVGFFFKESALALGVYIGVLLLMSPIDFFAKVKAALFFFFISGGIILVVSLVINSLGFQSIEGRYMDLYKHTEFVYYNSTRALQIFRVLDYHWIVIIIGLIVGIKTRLNIIEKSMLITGVLIIIIQPIVHPYIEDRLLFMAVPFFVPLAVRSFLYLGGNSIYLVLSFGFLSVWGAYLIYAKNTEGLLKIGLFIAIILMLGFRKRIIDLVFSNSVNNFHKENN